MTTFIARSGSLPVNINIKLSHNEWASEDMETVLLGQQYRTKRLEIHDDRRSDTLSHRQRQEPLNLISKLRSTPAPILESLTITMALRSNSHLPPPLCADLPTCLKTISLFGCTMPTTMIIPDSLQSLTLSHTAKESPPGLRHLLMVLQRARHIKTLDLSFAAKFTTEDDSSAPVVYMPHLESLKITFDTLRHHYIAYLHIIHPASTKVELEFRKASRDPINPYPPYVDGIRALGGVIAQRFSGSLRRLRISASTRNVSHILKFYDHDDNPKPSTKPCLKMQIFYAEPYKCKILSAFCEGLEMKYVQHLSLSDTSRKVTDLQLCMPIIGQWPSLSTIVYYGNPSQLAVAMTADVKKHDRLIRLARALKEVRVSFILTLTGVTASLLIAFIVTVSAWTEPGCKDPDKDPHKDLGDKFKQGLDSFCSAKKAGAIFSWLAFGFWAASLTLLILDWRSGRLTVAPRGPRDPPFQTPTQHHDDVEEGLGHEEEEDEEHDYMHVPRPTQPAVSSAAYTPNSRYEPPLGNDHNPNSPFADDNRYAGRPSMDAYGAFSDPAPSGFVQAQQQQQQEAPRISRTMQYADPYAAVRASVASSAAASTPPSYESYSLR
ncbi:hypothetical protein H0H93_015654 [Arthromyces matolae]|nr:hypothetical protein H0H93_015654 [Arthromyces matolae]